MDDFLRGQLTNGFACDPHGHIHIISGLRYFL
jgi:hypothetical protein